MRVSMKVILGLWVSILIVLSLMFYNAYTKLRPETFVALLSEQVQKHSPGTRLEVGKVDYRLSINFNLNLSNVALKKGDVVISRVRELELRVPWWLLLFNRGKAQINVTDLEILIDSLKSADSSDEDIETRNGKKSRNQNVIEVKVPDYLADAKFTLRAKNISIRELSGSRRFFRLNKLLVREFQYGKNSAFELQLPMELNHKDVKFSSELWLFGDVTPDSKEWELNFRGEFRTKDPNEKVQLEDLIIQGKARFKPHLVDVYSTIGVYIDKKEIGAGTLEANSEELGLNFNFSALPVSVLNIFEQELKNPYLKGLEGSAEGPLKISKRYSQTSIKLSSVFHFDGNFHLADKTDIPGQWRLSFENSRWETSFMSPKGEVSYFRRAFVDLQDGSLKQYNQELGFTAFDVSTALQAAPTLGASIAPENSSSFHTSSIVCKKCLWNTTEVEATFKYGTTPDSRFYQAEIEAPESASLKINYQALGNQHKLDMNAIKFPWSQRFNFLNPYFVASAGTLDGKVEGRWIGEEWIKGQWLSSVKVSNLQEATGTSLALVQSFWSQFEVDSKSASNQAWNGFIKNGAIKIDSLSIEGTDTAKLTGFIDSAFKQKSFVVLNYPKNKKWKPVRKEIKTSFWAGEPQP